MSETDQARAAGDTIMTSANVPVKIFPITVPIMGPEAFAFFQPPPVDRLSDEVWIHDLYPVQYSLTRLDELAELVESPRLPGPEWHRLVQRGEELSLDPGANELIAPRHLAEVWRRAGVIPYPHQLETARRVLFEMGGRAILADEVGLGKTIEAGLIIKECLLRQMARKVLILTPAGLVWQWFRELKEKFNLVFGMQRSEYDWERTDLLIASLDTAKRSPHQEIIHRLHYDILVVDEAHKLKNASTQSYQFVNRIRRKFCLMLTATPVQNDLKELFNLINLLRPGHFGTYRQFRQTFVQDQRMPKETEELKRLLSQVMIRNRRGPGTVQFTARRVHALPVDLSPRERRLYDGVTQFVKQGYRRGTGFRNLLPLITLQREVCSSPIAAAVTLEKLLLSTSDPSDRARLQELLTLALEMTTNSKAEMLERLLADLGDEKVIVFTEYRATQQYLRWRLEKAGFSTLGFDGSLSASRKEWIRELFRRQAQVLVSTEAGGEGINFQFCCHVVNYDLPWNPMRLEQRIGRVHRLGQTRDVSIYNFATRGTVEEDVLYLLYDKINMFEMVLGELDVILSKLKLGGSFEKKLAEILVGSTTPGEIRERLDRLAQSILEIRRETAEGSELDRLLRW